MTAGPSFRHPRYEILRILGEGGMGRVYLARDRLEGGRQVALKVYPVRGHDERLRDEFLALRELHHPAISRALHYGVSETDGSPFFTLEYVEGSSLLEWLSRRPPRDPRAAPPGKQDGKDAPKACSAERIPEALWIFTEVASAVAYLHRRGLLHLDVKPENILVVDLGPELPPHAVLIDFGLAHRQESRAIVGHGTLPYMAPELFAGLAPGPPADVYSLGATFYRAFSGRYPVDGTTFDSFAKAHRTTAARPIPEAPPEIERILLRALAKDPAHRFEDANDLHRALTAPPVSRRLRDAGLRAAVFFHDPDFVGRAPELEALSAWLERDRREAPILEVHGGSGWGKSRFLEKAETLIEVRGKSVLSVRVTEEPGCVIRECARFLDLVEEDSRPRRPASRRRSPGEPGRGRGKAAEGEPSDGERGSLARRVTWGLLPHLRRDLFLVVDDLHAADPDDRATVDAIARSVSTAQEPPGGGLIVSRGGPGPDDRDRSSARGCLFERIELGPFRLDEALRVDLEGLDGALAGVTPDHARRLKAELHRQVGGHPLFYVRGLLDLAGQHDRRAGSTPEAAVAAQVRTLPDGPRAAALCLACLARAAEPAELERILEASHLDLAAALRRLRFSGVVAAEGTRHRTIHDSVRDAILATADPQAVRDMHGRIAWILDRADSCPGDAAWHLLEAGRVDEALDAGRRWTRSGLRPPTTPPEKGLRFLLRASELAGRTTEEGRELLEAAADVHTGLGRFEEAQSVLRDLVEATPGDRTPDEAAVRRLRKLGSSCHRTARPLDAARALEACLEPGARAAAPRESLRARVELANLYHFRGEADRASECSRAGIESWQAEPRTFRDSSLESAINLHAILGQVHIRGLRFLEAIAVLRDGLRLAERSRSRPDLAVLLNNLGLAHHLAGQLRVALEIFRRAEALAVETDDLEALVSIRSNIAQILSKKGRFREAMEILDEIERSPPARNSRRLLLGCLYSRGLLANLMRVDAEDAWSRVEELTGAVGDEFLRRLASIYRAEGRIRRGSWSAARELLRTSTAERTGEPIVAAMKLARRAHLEATAGHAGLARRLRQRAGVATEGLPDQLRAWNRHHLGLSALETGDLDEARGALEDARDAFARMELTMGEVESGLALAELSLRRGTREGAGEAARELRRAARRAEPRRAARRGPGDIRFAILEAWVRTIREAPLAASAGGREGRPRRPAADGFPRGPESAADLLSRAAGDPAIESDPRLKILVEILTAAIARLRGDRDLAAAATLRAEEAWRSVLESLSPRDRIASRARDPWRVSGLDPLRPHPAGTPLLPGHADALCALISAAATSSGPGSGSPLDAVPPTALLPIVAESLGAVRVDLLVAGEVAATWRSPLPPPARGPEPEVAGGESRSLAAAWPSARGPILLRVVASPGAELSARDARFLDAAAALLLPGLAALGSGRAPGAGATAGESTVPLEAPPDATATAALAVTRGLRGGKHQTAALHRLARKLGLTITPRVAKVLESARLYAASELPVLITGESGTGKNLVARLIHELSPRAQGPFVVQNSSAVPPELFEADLFGYESGAFTGAERTRTGFLFRAGGGTFHLEEVGDLRVAVQQILLRVIEERRVRPLGAAGPRPLDVRFLASTHRDLDAMVREGEFRADLFYRLNAARVHIPSLRERREEIPMYVEDLTAGLAGAPLRLPNASLDVLLAHDWPGNLRELASVLRRLALETHGVPSPEEVRSALGSGERRAVFPPEIFRSRGYEDARRALEESYLVFLHQEHQGDLDAIAAALGTTTRSVYRRFERLGLKPGDLKR